MSFVITACLKETMELVKVKNTKVIKYYKI